MIKKDTNSISFTMKPKGIIVKSVFFLSLLLTLVPNLISAFSLSSSEETIIESDSSYTVTVPKYGENILYVSEGTIVYGMENISQKSSAEKIVQSNSEDKKTKLKGRKKAYVIKTEVKRTVATRKVEPELVRISISNNSKDFFDIAKTYFKEGTVNNNLQLKVSILNEISSVDTISQRNTNSSYTYSNFLKGGLARSHLFTRPPPSFI